MPRISLDAPSGIRFDDDQNVVRSFFDPLNDDAHERTGLSNSAISDEFLAVNADLFNLNGIDLILTDEKEGSSQTTCKYDQYHQEIPVLGAFINVTLRKSGYGVISAVNRLDYSIPVDLMSNLIMISSGDAVKIMNEKYGEADRKISHSRPQLFIWHRLPVWRIEVDIPQLKEYWEVLINAVNGHLEQATDRRRFAAGGHARIFRPDPLTSSQNPSLHWGSPDVLLDGQLVEVVLQNLHPYDYDRGALSGKWVRIAEMEDPLMENTDLGTGFLFSSRNRKFLSVMAYYYLDRLIDWIRSLGIPAFNDSLNEPVYVDAQAVNGEDNSHFVVPLNGRPYLAFGEGGTPDASDPGVIVHEFGHALHYFLLGRLIAPGPFEEGFNDFLSCVFRDRFNDKGFDRANPFPWDNNPTVSWDPDRRCDVNFRFDDPAYATYGIYRKGSVYATSLWDIFLEMGGKFEHPDIRLQAAADLTITCLDTLLALGDAGPLTDLAGGLISSDRARTGGLHENSIRLGFTRRGFQWN